MYPVTSVAVIVPARNEADNIGRLAQSLMELHYAAFSVTIIDDHSDDATGQIAEATGAAVLRLDGEPPPGWTGKCNACEQGVQNTVGEWLLFTDADTCHQPDSLARAVAYAERNGLDAVSLLLKQECVSFWERVILPLAYQQFFAVLQPAKPAFNGQYILIRRAVYVAAGGFGAVRGRVMEDVALAEHLTTLGYKTRLLNGHDAASVRMYRGFPALLRGMTKTAFAAARDRGRAGWLLAGLTFLGVFALLLLIYGVVTGSPDALLGALWIMLFNGAGVIPWMRRFGVPSGYGLFNLIGISVLWLIGMVSTLSVISGMGIRWKGRTIRERR